MSPPSQLLGPPELHKQPDEQQSYSVSSSSESPSMDLMLANPNKTELPVGPLKGFTENLSATFLSTGNPCLDFFFHVVPNTPAESLIQRLEVAWKHNDLMTLKLICHLRGVRGTGKSDKEGFYTAALWLHENHPKTLACNAKWIADFGYFKDLPEILFRLLEGSNVREVAKEEFQKRQKPRNKKQCEEKLDSKPRSKSSIPQDKRIAAEMTKVHIQKEIARNLRKEKHISKARKAVERYSCDLNFKFLHDQISQVFADHLISDLKALNCGEYGKISLAAKWCPSLDSSFDKATLLCESIAKRIFPCDSYPEYEETDEAHYAFRVRDRLRKEVLVPLRQILELPEIYMSSNRWESLPYGRVPSVAMTNYKKHFLKHDQERFNEYLSKVERGEAKIAAGALFPHEIIKHLDDGDGDGGQVAELQWKRMVDDLSLKGTLKNCIAVCDVSGSMHGTPMDVSVSLGLLLSELSEHPWKGKVITFTADPELHIIEGNDLRSKTRFIRDMDFGMNTNFQKVFDKILEVAVSGNLSKDKMIKKVFVFSDMEFDRASRNFNYGYLSDSEDDSENDTWNTDYEVIQKKFQDNGYTLPEIVFWNLRDSKATPVPCNQKGVALVSGFSKNLMKMFLEEEEIPSPEAAMELALSGPEYKQLVVFD